MSVRVLIDVRPPILADALERAITGRGADVVRARQQLEHDDSVYDLVVIDDSLRLARPGRLTVRVDPANGDDLTVVLDLVQSLQPSAPAQPLTGG